MLQLKLVKTVPYLACGGQNIKEVYRGTNVSNAEVEITHHNRHSTHELSSSVGVFIRQDVICESIGQYQPPPIHTRKAKVFRNMEEAKRWAETQVCMSWDTGEVNG
tara:strand:- start:1614 stop:1931 length:318 start_codon:yes stop_codon:yes gene_type:complete